MQKKLIALAVAGLSTTAIAQTNVTIYGVADISAQGYNINKGTQQYANGPTSSGGKFGIQNNGSLLGFKGTEDLGNGLKGLFQIETNVNLNGSGSNANTTSGSTFGSMRDSYVGLNSKYGTVLGGYLSTPLRSTVTGLDVFPGAQGSAAITSLFGQTRMPVANAATAATSTSNQYGTANYSATIRTTAIAYALPTLYGFNGTIAYTGNGANNNVQCNGAAGCDANSNTTGLGFNLGWDGYGVGLRGAFQQMHVKSGVNTNMTANWTNYIIGAQYTGVPGLKLAAAYGRATVGENGNTNGAGAAKGSQNQIWAGASYRFGNNEPRVMYASNSNISGLSQNAANGTPQFGGQNGASQWGLGWGYYLSKRTQVYGIVSQIKNNANADYNFQNATAIGANGGTRQTTYGAGLRTNF